jgi:hypothetical protein
MQRHDFHHRAFKKFAAQNKPFEYQVADKLFSYAGFIRYASIMITYQMKKVS